MRTTCIAKTFRHINVFYKIRCVAFTPFINNLQGSNFIDPDNRLHIAASPREPQINKLTKLWVHKIKSNRSLSTDVTSSTNRLFIRLFNHKFTQQSNPPPWISTLGRQRAADQNCIGSSDCPAPFSCLSGSTNPPAWSLLLQKILLCQHSSHDIPATHPNLVTKIYRLCE